MPESLCAILDEQDFVEELIGETDLRRRLPVSIADGDWFEDDTPLPPSTDSPKYYVRLTDEEVRIIQEGMEAERVVQYHVINSPFAGCFEPDHYLIIDGKPL